MKGVLIVGHGSRQKSTERTLEAVVEMARLKLPDIPMEIAYMEFGEMDIPSGLNSLIDRKADEIAVVPYFLFDGIHILEDIPGILSEFEASHEGVKISMGRPLGADERLASILHDRIREVI